MRLLIFTLIIAFLLGGCASTPLNTQDEEQFDQWHKEYHEYQQEPHEWYHNPHK